MTEPRPYGSPELGPPAPLKPPKYWTTGKRLIAAGVLLGTLMLGGLCGIGIGAASQPQAKPSPAAADKPSAAATAVPTPTPAKAPAGPVAGTVLLDISGTGSKKSQIFTTTRNWDLAWSADGGQYGTFISIRVLGESGSYIDLAANSQVPAGQKLSDVTHEHQACTCYLDISGLGNWSVKVTTA